MEQDYSKVDVSEDVFYTDENIAKLERRIADIKAGKNISEHELIEENWCFILDNKNPVNPSSKMNEKDLQAFWFSISFIFPFQ